MVMLKRLEGLYKHLTEEGWHVHANTVALAMEEIEKAEKMRKSASLLLQHVEIDFELHGPDKPDWLVDCRKDIVA